MTPSADRGILEAIHWEPAIRGVIDRILADGRDYLAGPYSIGDIMHFPWLRIAQNAGLPWIAQRERLVKWLDRIAAPQ